VKEKASLKSGIGFMIMHSTMIWQILIRVPNMLVLFLEVLLNTPTLVEEEPADNLQNQVRLLYLLFCFSLSLFFNVLNVTPLDFYSVD
jgi:hypothetical protein